MVKHRMSIVCTAWALHAGLALLETSTCSLSSKVRHRSQEAQPHKRALSNKKRSFLSPEAACCGGRPCALGEPCGAATRAGCNAPARPYTHLPTSTLSDAPLARPFSYGHMLTSQAGPAAAARSTRSRKTMRTLRCAPHVPCAPVQQPGGAGLHTLRPGFLLICSRPGDARWLRLRQGRVCGTPPALPGTGNPA